MVATSTPEAPYLQDPCSTWSRVRGTPGPEDGSQPGVSPVGLLGMEGRGLEGGSSGSAGCAGGSALLPAAGDSFFHRKRRIDRAGLRSPRPLRAVCALGRPVAQPQAAPPDREFQQIGALSDKPSPATGLACPRGYLWRAALPAPSPEPRAVLGTTAIDGLALGSSGGRQAQRQGGAAGQGRATGCQQRVVLPHIRPRQAPPPPGARATSLGTLRAGCCAVPLSGDQEPLDRPPGLERRPRRRQQKQQQKQQQPPVAEGCPLVMLPLAPASAGPNQTNGIRVRVTH